MQPKEFNPAAYGPEAARILESGSPGLDGLAASSAATAEMTQSIGGELFTDSAHPRAALSGLWLYLDCFDEAHKIAQDDQSREGSLWHAVAHRREPDYGNSKYWYRQLGSHPTYPAIHEAARHLIELMPAAGFRVTNWDPRGFVEYWVDYCQEAERSGGQRLEFALRLQRAEWEILFDYCAAPRKRPL